MKIVNMMLGFALALVTISAVALPAASAHVYETSNGVSAIFHIKPFDRPVAKEPTTINLKFKDEAGGFGLNKYKVTLTFKADGVAEQTQEVIPAFFGAAAEGETVVTFPQAAMYSFQLKGIPKSNEKLPFTLNYTAKVVDDTTATAAVAKSNGDTAFLFSAFSLVIVGMVAVKTIHKGGRYRQSG